MVVTTLVRFTRNIKGGRRGPDRFWKRRKILRQSAHFYGRRRNCYSIAIRYVHRAWQYITNNRKTRKERITKIWEQRIAAACEEHGINFPAFRQGLLHLDILLDRKVLSQMAVFEPRTFKSLANLAMGVHKDAGLNGINQLSEPPPPGVYTRNLLKPRKT